MMLFQFLLFYMLFDFTLSTSVEEENDVTFNRILRDISGQYHPELHGEHAHEQAHTAHTHELDPNSVLVNTLQLDSNTDDFDVIPENKITGGGGYYLPPPPYPPHQPPPHYVTPNGYANCACFPNNHCTPELVATTAILLKQLKNDVVCGRGYDLCCYDDFWPGPRDPFIDMAPCVPSDVCVQHYGNDPYDVQNYGVIGPCLGLGSVRCLDGKPRPPTGPSTVVIPIYTPPSPTPPIVPPTPGYEYVPVPTPAPPVVYTPPTVYEPPVTYEAPIPPVPVVTYAPPVETYKPPPPVTYEAPVETYKPPPPVTYEAPVETYKPPPPVTYEAPVETYKPPPPVTYEAPVETYKPPPPVLTYEPPTPVDTYQPPTPVATYEPPTPVDTYEPPSATYEPPVPGTSYGVPAVGLPTPVHKSFFGSRFPYRGYYSRFGYPYGRGYGFGLRKRFHFSKGFYG